MPASTEPTDPALRDGNRVADAAASIGAGDVFVFRRITADRFVHVGGLGRGEGWAGNIDLILADDARAREAIASEGLVSVAAEKPVRIFGPYYQRSAVFVPLSNDLLVVFGNLEDGEQDPEAVRDAADAAAAAIAQVSSAKRLADELELLHALQSLAQTDAVRIREVMLHVAESAIVALSCDLGVMYVAQLDEIEVAEHEPTARDVAAFLPAMRQLYADATSLPACVQDSATDPPPVPLSSCGVTSHYVLPVGEPPFAVLALMHTADRPRGFTSLCREVGLRLAESAEPMLRSALKLHDLEAQLDQVGRDARLDPLTKLPNRRAWEEAVEKHDGCCAGIVVVDVDKLKVVNDERGHHVGDEYLQVVSQTMATSLREGDFLARVGGDEFAILLPDADETVCRAVARRVNRALLGHPGFAGYPLAASLGYAATPPEPTIEDAWRKADAEMYQGKPSVLDRRPAVA